MKKLSTTAQWLRDHPNDTPPPPSPDAAAAWRRKRNLHQAQTEREKYEAALAEMKERPADD